MGNIQDNLFGDCMVVYIGRITYKMCARFNQKITSTEIQRFFEAAGDVFDELTARINTAPTQSVLAISGVNPRILGEYR